eukprot:158129-Prorocentrum_lima.AAC.1
MPHAIRAPRPTATSGLRSPPIGPRGSEDAKPGRRRRKQPSTGTYPGTYPCSIYIQRRRTLGSMGTCT